ncbi:MAG: glycosyltransferase family 4 protein [Arenicellales bacterium]
MATKMVVTHNTTRYLDLHYGELLSSLVGRGITVVVVAPRDDHARSLEERGIRCVDMRLSQHGMNPARELLSVFSLGRILLRERPDALFNFSIKPVIYGSMVARVARVPKVCSMITGLGYVFIEGGALKGLLRRFVVALYRLSLGGNQTVFFQNEHDRDLFVRHRIVSEAGSCVLPGTGIDTSAFSPGEPRNGDLRFVMATRLIAEKGVREYVDAARALRKEYGQVGFLLAGPVDGSPSGIDIEEIRAWHAEGVVEYAGSLQDIRPLLHASDVLVLPSYYREGLPRSLVEAMACGLAVITTDWPGCRDCVEDGINGILVPPRDSRALEDAMRRFIEKPDLARTMGERGRAAALERYSVNKVNGQIMRQLLR